MRIGVNFYRDANGCDCTLDGVSSLHEHATLIWDEDPPENMFTSSGEPFLMLVRRKIGGETVLSAEPLNGCGNGARGAGVWYCFGGNFIFTSDSRFPSSQPIKVHDRHEK